MTKISFQTDLPDQGVVKVSKQKYLKSVQLSKEIQMIYMRTAEVVKVWDYKG